MVLEDPFMIESEKKWKTTTVVGVGAGNEQTLDNEVCITGNWRKVRRILAENLDNAVVQVTLTTGAAGALAATALYSFSLTQYQQRAWSPEELEEMTVKFLASATDNRVAAVLDALAANGVRIRLEYFDDISP